MRTPVWNDNRHFGLHKGPSTRGVCAFIRSDDDLPWARSSSTGDDLETKYPYVCHAGTCWMFVVPACYHAYSCCGHRQFVVEAVSAAVSCNSAMR